MDSDRTPGVYNDYNEEEEDDDTETDSSADNIIQPMSRRNSALSLWKASTNISNGTLYDRHEQEEALLAAYKRSLEQAEIVLITGASGTGKTVLGNTLVPHIQADGGLFLRGKFDQNRYVTNIVSPIFPAFCTFAREIVARGPEEAQKTRQAIEEELGAAEIEVLLELIPELAELLAPEEWQRLVVKREEQAADSGMEGSSHTTGSSGHEAGFDLSDSPAKVASIYRRFLRCASSPERPIVLFLDDLQWADEMALAVLGDRAYETQEEAKNPGFLFLATVRSDEVGMNDQLSVALRGVEDVGVTINDIQVGNLSRGALADMVAAVLELPVTECLPLVEVVYNQTQGNAFFSIQYLRRLQEEGILYHTSSSSGDYENDNNNINNDNTEKKGKWAWQEQTLLLSLEESGNDDMIVRLLAHKMRELPTTVKEVMKVAACLGSDFKVDVLSHSGAVDPSQILVSLDVAEQKGFITIDHERGICVFCHDKFQESAYSLIPDEERASYHLQIGRSLRRQLSVSNIRKHLTTMLNQIAFGLDQLTDPEEREEWAYFCLRAARKAGKASSFRSAREYAELGIKLLERRNWRDQYNLSLNLYNSAAETAYCCGEHERLNELTKEILENALTAEDKMTAHITKISSLAALKNSRAAITYCIEVLRRIGQHFPQTPRAARILFEFIKTKRVLSKLSDDDVLNLPTLKDPQISVAMVFMHQMFPLVQSSQIEYSPLIAFRLVDLTLKHGLSPISSVAFAFYGTVLARTGRVDDGYRYLRLAFRVLEKHPSEAWKSRCILVSAAAVRVMKEPLRELLPDLMTGHQLGLKCGDLETGFICASAHSMLRLLAGDPLPNLSRRLFQLMQLCHDNRQNLVFSMVACLHQVCINLMGKTNDPLVISGEYVHEDVYKEEGWHEKRTMLLAGVAYWKYTIALYCGQYDAADKLKKDKSNMFLSYHQSPLPACALPHALHEGLVAVHLARTSSRLKIWVARRRLKILRNAVLLCPENAINKKYLLEAEILAFEGRPDDALCRYDQSIEYAAKNGYVNEEGLANELAGRMLLRDGKESRALPFFVNARDLYARWGVEGKVDTMEDLNRMLRLMNDSSN